jgi:MFS family permease
MNRKFVLGELKTSFWGKVMMVSLVLFFVYLGDAMLSDWVPAYIQESVGKPWLMGLIISFSSMVGFVADLFLPQFLKKVSVEKMIVLAIGSSLIFCGLLLWSTYWPYVIIFLMAMAVWGVYYEFLGFGGQQFVSESIPSHFRSGAWAVLGAFRGLAYFVGPLFGSYLLISKGNVAVVTVSAFMVFVGYFFWILNKKKKVTVLDVTEEKTINVFVEAKHWVYLLKFVWPIVVLSLSMGLLDSTFWTTGTVLSDNMASESSLGGLFLPLYELPMVIMGIVVARWGIYKGKKKLAEIFMLITGILLSGIYFTDSVALLLTISFFVGLTSSVCWPLRDAVYSDLVSRMGFEGKHMIGLSGSTISLAYIIGPIVSGSLATYFGEKETFVIVGSFLVIVSIFLLMITPKKLRLPREEIQAWG